MFTIVTVCWLIGSLALIGMVLLARRRRGALARELHELRGAITSARLAVDLMPVLDLDKPGICRAASDELERTFATLADLDELLHSRLLAPSLSRDGIADAAAQRRARRLRLDAKEELERLALIWSEAARREGRELRFEWLGPTSGVFANGPKRRFAEVVANLLANAIRHGRGTITMTARMRSDSLRVEVSDEGPGLPHPISLMARRPQRGEHGHGLSIARESARLLGGRLTSAPSASGATFAFTIPAVHDPSAVRTKAGG